MVIKTDILITIIGCVVVGSYIGSELKEIEREVQTIEERIERLENKDYGFTIEVV